MRFLFTILLFAPLLLVAQVRPVQPAQVGGATSADEVLISNNQGRGQWASLDSIQLAWLAGKLNKSDTAAMLLPYLREIDTTGKWQPKGNYIVTELDAKAIGALADTSAILRSLIRNFKIWDTWNTDDTLTASRNISMGNYTMYFRHPEGATGGERRIWGDPFSGGNQDMSELWEFSHRRKNANGSILFIANAPPSTAAPNITMEQVSGGQIRRVNLSSWGATMITSGGGDSSGIRVALDGTYIYKMPTGSGQNVVWNTTTKRLELGEGTGGGGGTPDGNNFPTSLSYSGTTLTLGRSGLADLTATINTGINLTTTGNSGPATWNAGTRTLNIPQYSGGGTVDLSNYYNKTESDTRFDISIGAIPNGAGGNKGFYIQQNGVKDSVEIDYGLDVYAPNTVAFTATPTFNYATSINHVMQLTGNVTSITLSNIPDGKTMYILFKQDATGGRTVTGWPAGSKIIGGNLTLSTAANAEDVIGIKRMGSNYYITYGKDYK